VKGCNKSWAGALGEKIYNLLHFQKFAGAANPVYNSLLSRGERLNPDVWIYHTMSYIVTPFEVSSQALAAPVKVRFVHLFSAIATRHSDTIDCVFLADGKHVTVSIPCPVLTELREKEHKYLRDQQLADIAALHLRRTLEQGYDATEAELILDGAQFRALGKELGYL
jgi:hypothetical protein